MGVATGLVTTSEDVKSSCGALRPSLQVMECSVRLALRGKKLPLPRRGAQCFRSLPSFALQPKALGIKIQFMRRQLIALIVASALVLSGCSGDDTQIDNEAQPESTVSSSSGPDNSTEQTEATEESAQESSESNQAQDQIPVSTDRFQTSDNSWVVSTRDNGQCLMTAHEKRGTFGCILPFTDPKPPALSAVMDTGSPDIEPNAVAIEPVAGVVADWVPDFQGEEPVAYLEPGESTEFLGMTMAVLPDGTFKVSQGVH